jgi:hypothetical protein
MNVCSNMQRLVRLVDIKLLGHQMRVRNVRGAKNLAPHATDSTKLGSSSPPGFRTLWDADNVNYSALNWAAVEAATKPARSLSIDVFAYGGAAVALAQRTSKGQRPPGASEVYMHLAIGHFARDVFGSVRRALFALANEEQIAFTSMVLCVRTLSGWRTTCKWPCRRSVAY